MAPRFGDDTPKLREIVAGSSAPSGIVIYLRSGEKSTLKINSLSPSVLQAIHSESQILRDLNHVGPIFLDIEST
jgi:hypothetical protein